MENNESGGGNKVFIAVIALLLLALGGTGYFLYKDTQEKKLVEADNTSLKAQKDTVLAQLTAKQQELEALKGVDAGKDSLITAKEAEIETQKQQIKNAYASGNMKAGELKKAKELIAQYEANIADLTKQVDQLKADKQQLTNQNQQLSSDLSNEKQTTNNLTEQNKGLSKKVELGSLLQLHGVTVEGIEKKKNGKEVSEKKAKKVESLRITFETGDNKVLEAGKVTLYVRILNPKGETISVADQGSGTFKMNGSDQSVQYTKAVDFDWAQTNKKLIVYWSENIKNPGVYKVEIYQSGYAVGQGQVELK